MPQCTLRGHEVRVLFISSECVPFAKVGGLGDVVGSLPKALHHIGVDVRVLVPRYGFLSMAGLSRHGAPLSVPVGDQDLWCGVQVGILPGSDVPLYLLEHNDLYGAGPVYGMPDLQELTRFALLSQGAFQLCRMLDWIPDVMHVHDWPTAPVTMMLDTVERRHPFLETASVLTLHNLAHQPRFPRKGLSLFHLPPELFRPDGIEDHGALNPLKGGCYHATLLAAVSAGYAREIQTPEGGAGLDHVMRQRKADLRGIPNAIDVDQWNPDTDPFIPAHYSADAMAGKAVCKAELQRELGLPVRPDVPLIGSVTRLASQKGTDIVADALEQIIALDAQLVILGSGDPALESLLRARSDLGDAHFRAWIGFNEGLAHRIEAGSDLFLMPSRFEPCGLNQLYSQRYGSLPVVRATGGLDDSVEQYREDTGTGTGFKFYDLHVDALVGTLRWAIGAYRNDRHAFERMRRRAMLKPMSWNGSAVRHSELYRTAVSRKRGFGPRG